MLMYKGYKLRDVMDEYAIAFFTLLEQGYRLKLEEYRMQVNIISTPHMKEQDRKDFVKSLEQGATDLRDILDRDADDYSGLDDLRQMFGQK